MGRFECYTALEFQLDILIVDLLQRKSDEY
jgi:hypothetical protein